MDAFIAIDVETANGSRHSICQIGLVAFHGDVPVWRWSSLINPEEAFETQNVKIHGLSSAQTRLAPPFPQVLGSIAPTIENRILACHGPFDYEAMLTAAEKYQLTFPSCTWIDTVAIARKAWPALSSHKLDHLCNVFAIPVTHHDAGSDALACGYILARALQDMQAELPDVLNAVEPIDHYVEYRPTSQRRPLRTHVELRGRKDGPLAGHVLVCTGEMKLGELKIAELAAALGCSVEERFTQKRTTILVTGVRDPAEFNGNPKSRKLIEAEKAIAKGRSIEILTEHEFLSVAERLGVPAV